MPDSKTKVRQTLKRDKQSYALLILEVYNLICTWGWRGRLLRHLNAAREIRMQLPAAPLETEYASGKCLDARQSHGRGSVGAWQGMPDANRDKD